MRYFNGVCGSNSLSSWNSTALGRRLDAVQPSSDRAWHILLIDDRLPFRRTVASALADERVELIQAAGVYDAVRLARRRTVDLIVVRGNLEFQSGWRCAAKLCGVPPWRGVVMHFDDVTERDRNWAQVSGLTRLTETAGQPGRLVDAVQDVINATSARSAA